MRWALLALFVLAGCGTQGLTETDAGNIYTWHDDARAVTCWVYGNGYKGGLSCIPDKDFER